MAPLDLVWQSQESSQAKLVLTNFGFASRNPHPLFSRVAQRKIFEVPLSREAQRNCFCLSARSAEKIFYLFARSAEKIFVSLWAMGPSGPPLGPPSTISPRGNQTNLGPLAPSHGPPPRAPLGPPLGPPQRSPQEEIKLIWAWATQRKKEKKEKKIPAKATPAAFQRAQEKNKPLGGGSAPPSLWYNFFILLLFFYFT